MLRSVVRFHLAPLKVLVRGYFPADVQACGAQHLLPPRSGVQRVVVCSTNPEFPQVRGFIGPTGRAGLPESRILPGVGCHDRGSRVGHVSTSAVEDATAATPVW